MPYPQAIEINSVRNEIFNALMNGAEYIASASGTTAGAADPGMSLFNNATSKNILIFAIQAVANATSTAGHSIRSTTTDPALGSAVTPQNGRMSGGAASAIASGCSSSNSQGSLLGSLYYNFPTNSGSVTELLTNGMGLILPAGVASGLAIQFVFGGAQSWYTRVAYLEL